MAQQKKQAFHSRGSCVGILALASFHAVDLRGDMQPGAPVFLGETWDNACTFCHVCCHHKMTGCIWLILVLGAQNASLFLPLSSFFNCFLITPVLMLDLSLECPHQYPALMSEAYLSVPLTQMLAGIPHPSTSSTSWASKQPAHLPQHS